MSRWAREGVGERGREREEGQKEEGERGEGQGPDQLKNCLCGLMPVRGVGGPDLLRTLLPLGFGSLFAPIPWVWAPFRPDPFPRPPRGAPRQPKTAPRGSKSRPRLPTEAPRASQDRPPMLQIPSKDRSPARVWATFRLDQHPRLPTVAPGEPKTAHIGPKSRPRPPT